MKILYICRIFSGLELSIKSRRWKPTGVPTIYKILEYFDKSEHKLQLVLTDFGVGLKHKTVFNNNKIFLIYKFSQRVLRNSVPFFPFWQQQYPL